MNKMVKLSASLAIAAGLLLSATPSFAADAPDGGPVEVTPLATCSPDGTSGPWFSFGSKTATYIADPSSRIYGDPGVTLSIQVGKSYTFSSSVTGTTGITVDELLVKANASLAIQTAKSRTTTLTQAGSWTVPGTKQGWFEVGTTNAYSFTWEKYKFNSPCTKVVLATGKSSAPLKTASPYFKHS